MSSTPTRTARRWSWVLLIAAVGAAGAAVVVGLRQRALEDSVVLDVSTEIAETAPSTISPVVPEPTVDPGIDLDTDLDTRAPGVPPAVPPTTAPPTSSTVPAADDTQARTEGRLSPLAAVLGPQGSAIPPSVEPRTRPASLRIGEIDLDTPVRAVGLADDGELEVPDETEVGWYRYGAAPGLPGATVLAAHVTWNRTTGPFFRLGELEPGARVDVTLEDGSRRIYEVVERTMFDKDQLPRTRIWRTTGPETLVLITCGGDYNPDIRRYRQNIVVFAVPVGTDIGATT